MTQTVENPVVTPASTTATLLQRVILPRAGDPMAVRALYVDEHTGIRLATVPALPGFPPRQDDAARGHRQHRAAAARALPHVGGRAGAERGVVRGLLQRVRRGLLAALEHPHRRAAAPHAARLGPRRRLPHQGRRLPDLRARRRAGAARRAQPSTWSWICGRSRTAAGTGSTSPPTTAISRSSKAAGTPTSRAGAARPSPSACRRSTGPPTASPPSPRSARTRSSSTRWSP